jgi:translation initiation factor RLI1
MKTRQVAVLSGGELQRFAIAARLVCDAEMYMFDEPSSYLDVRQRSGDISILIITVIIIMMIIVVIIIIIIIIFIIVVIIIIIAHNRSLHLGGAGCVPRGRSDR